MHAVAVGFGIFIGIISVLFLLFIWSLCVKLSDQHEYLDRVEFEARLAQYERQVLEEHSTAPIRGPRAGS